MRTRKKLNARLLSLALSAAMACSMMPATVFAAEGDSIVITDSPLTAKQ